MPIIVGIPVKHVLVAVVRQVADGALGEIIRNLIGEITVKRRVVVIASYPLGKSLRRDIFAILGAELEVMAPLHPTDILHQLVKVLDAKLRSVRIGSQLDSGALAESDD